MKFWAIRSIAGLPIAIGAVVLMASLFMVFVAVGVINDRQLGYGPTMLSALVAIGLFIVGVAVIAQGQLLQVFLQIEENTRPR
jgi:hypothetical protein